MAASSGARLPWPRAAGHSGFECPRCKAGACWSFRRGGQAYRECTCCGYQCSLIAGTMFAGSKLPLTVWLMALQLLSPSLRVGFMAVPPAMVSPLVNRKVLSVLGSSSFAEAIVEAVLETGRFARHVQEVRARLVQYRLRALAALSECGIEVPQVPGGGMFLWGRLPGLADSDALVRNALRQGALLAKGDLFSARGSCRDHFRFNVVHSCDRRLAAFLHPLAMEH
jgi:hypothetical protein